MLLSIVGSEESVKNTIVSTLFRGLMRCFVYLVEEKLDIVHGQDGAAVVHVLLEVPLEVLEHEGEGLVRVHDVVESHCNIKQD